MNYQVRQITIVSLGPTEYMYSYHAVARIGVIIFHCNAS